MEKDFKDSQFCQELPSAPRAVHCSQMQAQNSVSSQSGLSKSVIFNPIKTYWKET